MKRMLSIIPNVILVCLALLAVFSAGCGSGKSSPDITDDVTDDLSGTLYEFNNLSVVKNSGAHKITLTVSSVEVSREGYMKFNIDWSAEVVQNKPGYNITLTKYSDIGNTNMYVTDNMGNRYDHIRLGGAAAEDTAFVNNWPIYGWYLFPPAKEGTTSFTFHDADGPPVSIKDIVLSENQSKPLPDAIPASGAVSSILTGTINEGQQIYHTEDGGWIIAGSVGKYNTADLKPRLIKLDSNGNSQWDWLYNLGGPAYGTSVQQTNDGSYVMAGVTNKSSGKAAWVLKTDSDGKEVWRKTLGDVAGEFDVALCRSGNGGYVVSYQSYNSSWLVSLDSSGNEKWRREFKYTTNESGYSINENVYFTSVKQTTDGGIVAGGQLRPGSDRRRAYLVKVDADGNKVWDKVYDPFNQINSPTDPYYRDIIRDLQATPDGGYALVGETRSQTGGRDLLIAKVNGEGTLLWNKTIDKGEGEVGYSIVQVDDSGFMIAGQSKTYYYGREDFWIVRTDAYGSLLWDKSFGGDGTDILSSIDITADGVAVAAGSKTSYGPNEYSYTCLISIDKDGEVKSIPLGSTQINAADIPGKYTNFENGSEYIQFEADGSWSMQENGSEINGTWAVENNMLILTWKGFRSEYQFRNNFIGDDQGRMWMNYDILDPAYTPQPAPHV